MWLSLVRADASARVAATSNLRGMSGIIYELPLLHRVSRCHVVEGRNRESPSPHSDAVENGLSQKNHKRPPDWPTAENVAERVYMKELSGGRNR